MTILELQKNDIHNKLFSYHHEINCHGRYDYLFEMKVNEIKCNFTKQKMKFLQNAPKHIIASLMLENEKKDIRRKSLPTVLWYVEEFKSKAFKMYRKKNIPESIIYYSEVSYIS
jgi:hypothetical protein